MQYIGAEAGFESGKVVHISLGTGYVDTKPSAGDVQNYNAIDWLRYVVLENLNDGALQQVFATRAIYGDKSSTRPRMDFRRYNPLLTHDNVSRVLGVSLHDRPDPAELGLDSFEADDAELMIEIGRAYARKIDWSRKYAMPWDTEGGHPNPALTPNIPVDWADTPYID